MKKILIILSVFLILGICSCTNTNSKKNNESNSNINILVENDEYKFIQGTVQKNTFFIYFNVEEILKNYNVDLNDISEIRINMQYDLETVFDDTSPILNVDSSTDTDIDVKQTGFYLFTNFTAKSNDYDDGNYYIEIHFDDTTSITINK